MTIDLSGKHALVTGASAGIGRAIAIELARCGAFVFINYFHSEAGAQETLTMVRQAGGDGQIVGANVAEAVPVAAMIEAVRAKSPHLDILVNNAGNLVKRARLTDMNEELWDEVINLNLKSVYLCCRAALPLMTRGGRIINISSQAAFDGGGFGATHYAASKAAVITFSKGLAKEIGADGITVNCIAPGLTATAFHDTFSTPEGRAATVKNTPMGREGQPVDVANAVLFLASDSASYITGETININGGARMN